ncbi:MAG TPA: FAD/NAD(P)-binding oxidoreductase [Candidatus Sulfotelmatobacter sp.]|nr:FAD/NAD(P)-binding oxidoreductase [Candidatus Sulfotelmatobacter sp.]
MNRHPQTDFDVLVVGGGPAGIAAAVRAAECGGQVGLVDDNPALGGQIWRSSSAQDIPAEAATWYSRLQKTNVTLLCGMRVFHQPATGVLLAEDADNQVELRYRNLILATGARERFLPFPGWTLPNVMGAGGLQAMVKSGLPIRGKRVVIAGTGPLLLAVAAYLKEHGAEIPMICEQVSLRSLVRFGLALSSHPGKIAQGLRLKRTLAGVPFLTSCWPVAAHGERVLNAVTLSRGGKSQTIECDYLGCGFHLVPNTELPQLLGCAICDGYVQVDEFQRTNVKDVFCAGEPTSIGGVDLALVEGQIAGLAAAGHPQDARQLFRGRAAAWRFARVLEQTFRLRAELRNLPSADTVVCRCEDVSYARLREHTRWKSAKLHTRCGMGPCQGRVCGPATQLLFDWNPESVRPPVYPVRVGSLANASMEPAQVAGGTK